MPVLKIIDYYGEDRFRAGYQRIMIAIKQENAQKNLSESIYFFSALMPRAEGLLG
jgi:hypothetical protein